MSTTQEVRQTQDRQVAVSDDDMVIMDFTEPEKDPESGAEEAGTQTDLGRRRWGRCHRRKILRRQMEMQNDDCHFRSHYHEKKMMKKMAKKWMKMMMWRRMMFRMSYGGPFGMGAGAGFGCRRRMRMMAASMMDSTDASSSESGDRQEYGWRHRRCCRGRKFGRRYGEGKRLEDQGTEKGKILEAETQVGNTEEINQNTASASTSKDSVITQTTPENVSNQTESAASGRIHEKKDRRKEHKKWKRMRRVHFCDMSSDSSSDSSSSESSSDENEPAHEVTKPKEHGGHHWRHGGHHWRRGGRHHHHQETNAEGNDDERGDKCTKGRKAWKGKKFHKKMMKGMGRRGYFRRF